MPEKRVKLHHFTFINNNHFTLATLYKLKCNQPVTTVPTVGFNVECYLQGNVKLNIWVKWNNYECLISRLFIGYWRSRQN